MRQMYCVIDFKMSTAVDTDPAQNWIVKLPPSLLLSDPFFFFFFISYGPKSLHRSWNRRQQSRVPVQHYLSDITKYST